MRINVIIPFCLIILLSNCSKYKDTQIIDVNISNKCEQTARTWGEAIECLIRKKNNNQ